MRKIQEKKEKVAENAEKKSKWVVGVVSEFVEVVSETGGDSLDRKSVV